MRPHLSISRLVICPWDQALIISARFLRACSASLIRALDALGDKKNGTFHETAKIVNSLFGETWCIAACGSTNCQRAFERCPKNDIMSPPVAGVAIGR